MKIKQMAQNTPGPGQVLSECLRQRERPINRACLPYPPHGEHTSFLLFPHGAAGEGLGNGDPLLFSQGVKGTRISLLGL